MPKMAYKSEGNLGAQFDKFYSGINAVVVRQEQNMMIDLTNRVLALTPVWEGDSIVNWRWSSTDSMQLVETRGQNIAPGPTSTMPLGAEPRRSVNEDVVRQSLMDALRFNAVQDMYFTNASDTIVDLEYGLLPTPDRSRSPHGVVRLAIKEVSGNF